MKICPKCKAQLADDTVFCTGCGQKLETVKSSASTVCPKCGNTLSADTQFCTKCGAPVGGAPKVAPPTQSQTPPPVQPPQPTMNRAPVGTEATQSTAKNPMILIAGIIAVLLIGGLVFFNMGGGGGNSDIPKTADVFVSAYNRAIKDTAKEQGVDAKNLSIGDVAKDKMGIAAGFAGGKVNFSSWTENGNLVFQFMLGHDLESKAFFAVMNGFVKASGGDSDQVMKGLGILSGSNYNLPANYEKKYDYNQNLQYEVTSMGGAMTIIKATVKNNGASKPSSSANTQQAKPQSGQNVSGNKPQFSGNNYVDPMEYVSKKNQYNQEISALAADVNAYLGNHANFRKDKKLMSRAENISRQVYGTKEALRVANIKNTALKNKLLEVYEALQGRVDGLLDGIRASKNGGDYTPGFQRGGDAFDRFEEADAALNRML